MTVFFRIKKLKLFRLLIVLLVFIYFLIPQFVYSQKSITVDFSKKIEKRESIVGFLHFNDLLTLDKNIKILKPKYWRVGNALHDKNKRIKQINLLHDYNITPILVLTDFFAGTEDNWGKPFINPEKFKTLVKNLYLENGNSVIYDIWNEPNTDSWGGTRQQFFETFKNTHDVIRSLPNGNNAIITGPGISRFDEAFLVEFLEFCKKNNIKVDILNWHEGGVINDVLDVQKNIKKARGWVDKYSSIKIKKIFIPEILWHTEQFNPSAVLAYLSVIERNGASGACKTCWDTPAEFGGNTCWNNSIDGLLDPKGNTRSVWWAYKFYADSLDKRIPSQSSDESLIQLAYIDDNDDFSILFTNISRIDIDKLSVNFYNVNESLFKRTADYKLKFYEVTNTDEKPLTNPKLIFEKTISFRNSDEKIDLNQVQYNKMYVLSISKK